MLGNSAAGSSAGLEVMGEHRLVRIWYRHIYATDAVDVIALTNR